MHEDQTPNVRVLDPDAQSHRTHHPPDEDFVGFRTSWDSRLPGIEVSWDSGLRGIQDFVGPSTSWDLGLSGR